MEKKPVNTPIDVDFEQFWFNTLDYSQKQDIHEGVTFLYKKDQTQLFIRLYKKENDWISPCRAPFGGLEFSKETDMKTLFEFVRDLINEATADRIDKIRISLPPECYDIFKSDLMDEALLHAGFLVTETELNYHIQINQGDFATFIHESEKRRLKKCLQAGFNCSIEKNPDYDYIHGLISDCRKRKGYPLSMNLTDFKKMFLNFPDRYLLFVVKDKELIIAAGIGVKVRSDILYNFLPADHIDYSAYSPMVLLNKGMYDYCRDGGYQIYDLGIATVNGIRNEGLIKFKEHLGGKLSHKYSYEYKIDITT